MPKRRTVSKPNDNNRLTRPQRGNGAPLPDKTISRARAMALYRAAYAALEERTEQLRQAQQLLAMRGSALQDATVTLKMLSLMWKPGRLYFRKRRLKALHEALHSWKVLTGDAKPIAGEHVRQKLDFPHQKNTP